MGLLDDAIREHLELKRRTGADPGEVERLEHEAFGADEPVSHEHPEEPPEAPSPAADEVGHDESSTQPVEPSEGETEAEPASGPGSPEDEEHGPAGGDQPTQQFTLEERQEAERRPSPRSPDEEARFSQDDDATDQRPVDELEETPDFLQETPEHDRLWFEQRPPKDFDF